jgi:mono/diheme cytochrome c family protein
MTSKRKTTLGLAVATLLGLTGCELRQAMYDTGRVKPYEASEVFADGRSARPLVEGTVARGYLRNDDALHTGKVNGAYVTEFPFAVDRATLQRGRERYEIFCSVCHGLAGYGDGMVVQRGFKRPPSFHDEATKAKTVGYYYDVIANGFGVMPSYREQVPTKDRWAIAAYLRALQLSQSASMADVPEDKRAELQ